MCLPVRSKQRANRATCPTIDASLGVGMVGDVKAIIILLVAQPNRDI